MKPNTLVEQAHGFAERECAPDHYPNEEGWEEAMRRDREVAHRAFLAGARWARERTLEEAMAIVSRPSLIVDDRDKYALNRAWHAIQEAMKNEA